MDILLFFKELIIRLGAKSPKFFKVIQTIALVAGLVTGVPALLEYFDVVLPAALEVIANKAVSIASFVALFIASLTVDPKVIKSTLTTFTVSDRRKVELPFSQKQ